MFELIHDERGEFIGWALGFTVDRLDDVPEAWRKAVRGTATGSKEEPEFLYIGVTARELGRALGRPVAEADIGPLARAFFNHLRAAHYASKDAARDSKAPENALIQLSPEP